MAEGGEGREFNIAEIVRKLTQDESGTSPSDRAMRVFRHLKETEFDDWDLLCFAAEYLASRTVDLPALRDYAVGAIRTVYLAHYVRFEKQDAETN